MATAAVAARPGRTYFTPGVRISRLQPLAAGPDPGVELTEVLHDVMSVEVTQVHTGIGQYCITLNNWFDALPQDRKQGAGSRELLRGGAPLWPRFKYNDFAILDFGMRLRIDMRYFPDPEPELAESDAAVHRFVPMISGPITDMQFSFSPTQGATLTVCGEDDLGCLKCRNKKKVDYWHRTELDVLRDVLVRSGCPFTLAGPAVPFPDFVSNAAKGMAEAHWEGQTFLQYLEKFAERLDFEVFLEPSDLADPSSPLQFHFEPARSRVRPGGSLQVHVLEREKNLVEFNPTLKVKDQFTALKLQGRHRVRGNPSKIEVEADPAVLADELHRDVAKKDPELVSGPEVRRRRFGDNIQTESNETNIDEERAQVIAEAKLRRQARQFLTIDCLTIGLPSLRPGRHVEIRGFRPPFDGFYYATKAVHRFAAKGFTTRVAARRPGMPLPPYGEE